MNETTKQAIQVAEGVTLFVLLALQLAREIFIERKEINDEQKQRTISRR